VKSRRKNEGEQEMFIPERFVEEQVQDLQKKLGAGKAVIAVTGGVDTTLAAVLTHRAIGEQMVAVVIADGLMRGDEVARITGFLETSAMQVRTVDATQEFDNALNGVTERDEQRRAYQNAFYSVLGRVVREEKAEYLVQGTTSADVVKTEDGVELPDDIFEEIRLIDSRRDGLTIVEPLRKLNKHEVIKLAKSLGLPPEFVDRQPFPVVLDTLRESLVK
jgi:GMP synthase (glutamine-hydrolysing)